VGPENPDGADLLKRTEIDHDPLWVERILFAGEVFVQVGITLPESLRATVVDARVPVVVGLVDGVAASGQPVAVRNFDCARILAI
jgi:hypothetical protein